MDSPFPIETGSKLAPVKAREAPSGNFDRVQEPAVQPGANNPIERTSATPGGRAEVRVDLRPLLGDELGGLVRNRL